MEHPTDTRTALLSTAETLIRRRGYDAFSFADLAQSVGIRKASVHYHFPKKSDVAAAVIADYATRFSRQLDGIEVELTSKAEKIAAFIGLYREALVDADQICLCAALVPAQDALDAQARTQLETHFNTTTDWLVRVLDHADPAVGRAVSQALLAQVHGAQLLARTHGRLQAFDDAMSTHAVNALTAQVQG